jgi:hypothetical protein
VAQFESTVLVEPYVGPVVTKTKRPTDSS